MIDAILLGTFLLMPIVYLALDFIAYIWRTRRRT